MLHACASKKFPVSTTQRPTATMMPFVLHSCNFEQATTDAKKLISG